VPRDRPHHDRVPAAGPEPRRGGCEASPIDAYAIVGDCRAAALVSRAGSIDWLCWPRFDSPPLFAALLDERAGRFSIAPTLPFRSERRYAPDSNVLETRFHTDSGTATVTDLMPVASDDEQRRLLLPDHELLRVVRCERGEVEIEVSLEVRPDFGRERPRIRDAGKLGIRFETAAGLVVLRSEVPLEVDAERVRGRARLRAGEVARLSLTFADEWHAVLPPLGEWADEAVARTNAWWRRWVARLTYSGPERELVVRSALALRLLVYAPSGAIVAAPTTSLPERVGGDLNWDYRFCWVRDSALTVRALLGLGYPEEAGAFLSWLLHSTRLTQPELRILYDLHGKRPPRERVLDDLSGHCGSRPVRVGNAASEQLQLDVYGEVVDALTHFVGRGGALDRDTRRMLVACGEQVCKTWHLPDEGIWEPRRTGRAHHTHSRVLCWTALDRLLDLHAKGHLPGAPADAFARNRELIREDVERRAWRPALRSYSSRLDADELDASLLLLAWYGFAEASSERMRLTYGRIRERLGAGGGLLYRYRSGESPGEGAFGVCGFWGAEFLALGGGTVEEAQDAFRRLCRHANDVGLFAEEIDPATGAAAGNFPQAFTHVGLINAGLSIQRRLEGRRPLRRAEPEAGSPRVPSPQEVQA
jgi:GH15 family glucan-1,4-alpha-glucosidase